jgi:outer membrane protein OmpA-like peptidoglycan-associated protein
MFTFNLKTKKYSLPKNMSKINSDANEIAPQFNAQEKVLSFSSNGFVNAGGYDVFKAYGEKQKFSKPVNVIAINSSFDEVGYIEIPTGGKGLFASNRTGAIAKASTPNCCDDLFWFENNKSMEKEIEIDIFSLENSIRKKLDVGIVKLQIKNAEGNITIKELPITANNTVKFVPEPNLSYQVLIESDGYLTKSKDIDVTNGVQKVEVTLTKITTSAISIPNINYATGKWELTNSSKLSIDSTIYKYLVENPELKIEIRSHTDNIGSDASNLLLSDKRAKGVVSYLLSKGIEPIRLNAKGYGEKIPVATNETDEGKQSNRRTDFVVLGKIITQEKQEE